MTTVTTEYSDYQRLQKQANDLRELNKLLSEVFKKYIESDDKGCKFTIDFSKHEGLDWIIRNNLRY